MKDIIISPRVTAIIIVSMLALVYSLSFYFAA